MTEFKLPPSLPMDLDVTLDEEDLFLDTGYQVPVTSNYLDVDFKALNNRSESTSTPFVPRSASVNRCESPAIMHHSQNDSGFCSETSVVSSMLGSSTMSITLHTPSSAFIPIKNNSAFTVPRLTMETLSDSRSDSDSAYEEESSICSTNSSSAFSDSLSSTPDSSAMDVVFQALNLNACSGLSSENSSRYSSQDDLGTLVSDVCQDQHMSTESESSCESQVSVVEVCSVQLEKFLPNFSKTLIDKMIGKKIGVEQVDIVTELHNRSMTSCLNLIFGSLEVQDLCRLSAVCQAWRTALQNDPKSRCRRANYLKSCRTPVQKENICTRGKDSSGRSIRGLVDRKAEPLSTIQVSTPEILAHSSEHTNKYQQFQVEASKLHNDESLRKCPHCDHPAKAHSVQERAVCSNSQCGFDFCLKCFSQYHGSKDCCINAQLSHKKLKTESKIGSKKSKRNLRRL